MVVADRFYPSTKTCSSCRAVKAKLSLAVRTYSCDSCGLVLDRDINAAVEPRCLGRARPGRWTATRAARQSRTFGMPVEGTTSQHPCWREFPVEAGTSQLSLTGAA